MENNLTKAYSCFLKYQQSFFIPKNIEEILKENRRFVAGDQYEKVYDDMPRPVFNICREDIEKTSAKILETPASVTFISNTAKNSLDDLDHFYEYQTTKMKDSMTRNLLVKNALIDGIGICFTAFDRDTIGIKMSYKGYLKRQIVPFEQCFFENPFINDIQDQRYLGYYIDMDVESVIECLEGSKKEIEEKKKLLEEEISENNKETDTKQVRVYIRFFRSNGEVVFEMSTQYVDIYSKPHFINPDVKDKDFETDNSNSDNKEITDYKEQDPTKYVIFQKPIKVKENYHYKSKEKFYLYPVVAYVPYQLVNSIIGESKVAQDIPNQKIANYADLLTTLIMQNHAMPKVLVKPEALKDQEYDNSPNQVLKDYTPISSGVQWGITKLGTGDAINSNLIEISNTYTEKTRRINGFADLSSEMSANTSGYLYEQMVRQQNLTLQQPQKRYWEALADQAAVDLQFFKHYIDETEFYILKDNSEIELQENYGNMARALEQSAGIQESQVRPVEYVQSKTLTKEFFDQHFDVNIVVEQGVAGSQISESQHFNELWQYIAAGNITSDKIKMLVECDPGISRKTKQRIANSLEALETSQLEMLTQENNELKKYIEQLMNAMKQTNQQVQRMQMLNKAQQKAFNDSLKENQAVVEAALAGRQEKMSESEVKSNNAKGKGGTSFS